MSDSKPWYLSRTVWASFITVGSALAGLFGVSVDGAAGAGLTDSVLQLITAASGAAAIVSRIAATHKLH